MAKARFTSSTTGSHSTDTVGLTPYTAIIRPSRNRLAPNATVSVSAVETGTRFRGKDMFTRIDRRIARASSELITVIIRTWNGTTAQARLRPGAPPGRFSTKTTSSR